MKAILPMIMLASLLGSASVLAKPAQSEKQANTAVQFRQALFQLIRSNIGALGAMSKGKIPYDRAQMEKNALRLEQLSLMLTDYFVLDTRKFNLQTEALPQVWENHADFVAKADELTVAAVGLKEAAKSADKSRYKAAIGQIFNSCKSCHDDYKAD